MLRGRIGAGNAPAANWALALTYHSFMDYSRVAQSAAQDPSVFWQGVAQNAYLCNEIADPTNILKIQQKFNQKYGENKSPRLELGRAGQYFLVLIRTNGHYDHAYIFCPSANVELQAATGGTFSFR